MVVYRCGLSILPECHQGREQRSGAHVVLQRNNAKYILKQLFSVCYLGGCYLKQLLAWENVVTPLPGESQQGSAHQGG